MRRFLLPFTLCASAILCGCGFEAPAPARTPAPPTPVPPISTFSATLTISAAQIARILNNMTEYRLIGLQNQEIKCGGSRCRINLHATRRGPITVLADNGSLTVRLPFAADIDAAAPGFLSFLHAKADGQGTAVARTELSLERNWRLSSSTNGDVQLDNAHLRVGPVVTNIAQLWNDNAQSLSRPLWRSIDKQIESFNSESRLADFWRQAFTPVRVGKAPISWLVLRPEQLEIGQPVVRDGVVAMSLGIEARGRVVVQDQQPVNFPTPLPHASPLAVPSNAFSSAVSLLLPYDQAARLAMSSLARRPPRIAGMTLKFTRLQILPSGQDVVVAAQFCADPNWDLFDWFASCGTVYLRGAPQFDPTRQTIRVTNLHYDVASGNLMLSAVRALAGDRFATTMQNYLVFDESKEIARLKAQVIAAAAKPEGRDVSISAQVQSFGEPSLTWTADGFLAIFSAKGKVEAKFNL